MAFKDASSPAVKGAAVTPSNTVVFDPTTKALYIGGAGNVAVVLDEDSAAVTFAGVAAGQILPVKARQVMATNTTATNIVALY